MAQGQCPFPTITLYVKYEPDRANGREITGFFLHKYDMTLT